MSSPLWHKLSSIHIIYWMCILSGMAAVIIRCSRQALRTKCISCICETLFEATMGFLKMYSAVEHVCMSEYVHVPDIQPHYPLTYYYISMLYVSYNYCFVMVVVHILTCLNTFVVIVIHGVNNIDCLVQNILVLWQTYPY